MTKEQGGGSAADLGMTDAQLKAAIGKGEVLDLGSGMTGGAYIGASAGGGPIGSAVLGKMLEVSQGERRYVKTEALRGAEASYERGRGEEASQESVERLVARGLRGDVMSRFHEARGSHFLGGRGGAGAATALSWAQEMDFGEYGIAGTLGLTGKTRDKAQDFYKYFAAQEAGLLDKDVGYKQYQKMAVSDKLELQGKTITALETASRQGSRDAAILLERSGMYKESGLMAARDIEAARTQFDSRLATGLVGRFGRPFTREDPLGLGRARQGALVDRLTTDSNARAAYEGFMRSMVGKKQQDAVGYMKTLEEQLGEDSPEYKAVQSQFRQMQGMGKGEREQWAKEWEGGYSKLFTDRALLEKTERDNVGLRSRLDALGTEGMDPRLQDAASKLRGAARNLDPGQRRRAVEQLFSATIGTREKGGGLLSKEEIALLEAAGGGGAGVRVAEMVSGLQTGKKETLAEFGAMEAGGKKIFGKGELEAIKGMKEEEQGQAIAAALKKAGVDISEFGGPEGAATSIQGTPEAYAEANTRFVQAVAAFVSAVGPELGLDVEGVSKNVQQAANDIPAGKNT